MRLFAILSLFYCLLPLILSYSYFRRAKRFWAFAFLFAAILVPIGNLIAELYLAAFLLFAAILVVVTGIVHVEFRNWGLKLTAALYLVAILLGASVTIADLANFKILTMTEESSGLLLGIIISLVLLPFNFRKKSWGSNNPNN